MTAKKQVQIDRLYTAFVSSTYKDLVEERRALADALLSANCVPLGMEFFPSTGRSLWQTIVQTMMRADFCVFLIAGRFGSVVHGEGISWTQKEFREAQRQGKPMVGLLHQDPEGLPPPKVELDAERRESLMAFRAEVEDGLSCRYFRDRADMLSGLYTSVLELQRGDMIRGWVPAAEEPAGATEFGRTYELIEIEWSFSRSMGNEKTWDGRYMCRRRMRGNDPDGIKRCSIEFSRDNDALRPFTRETQPILTLEHWKRSGQGSVSLRPPRKTTGANFLQDAIFQPALGSGEVVDFVISGSFPQYKFAYREPLVESTLDTRLGLRSWDYAARRISFPTERLIIRIFLPGNLGVEALGPRVGKSGMVDEAESLRLYQEEYKEWSAVREGVRGKYMELSVQNPRLRWTYRVAWELPSNSSPG